MKSLPFSRHPMYFRRFYLAAGLVLLIATALPWRRRSRPRRLELAPGPTTLAVVLVGIALLVPNRGAAPHISVTQTLLTVRTVTEGSGEVRLALWRNTGALLADAHPTATS